MAEFCVCVCVYLRVCLRRFVVSRGLCCVVACWGLPPPTNYTTHAYHISVIYNLHSVILVLISRVVSLSIYIFFKFKTPPIIHSAPS